MYVPNEEACPIPLDRLGMLMRSTDTGDLAAIAALTPDQRAELAFFCYRRAHLRALGLKIAALCELSVLQRFAGEAGSALYRASRDTGATDKGYRGISLAAAVRV
jgi:hypothetical protein